MSVEPALLFRSIELLLNQGTVAGLDERALLERFATHRDGRALAVLIATHGPMVLGVCRRFLREPQDVEDAFQSTFLVLVRRAGSIRDPRRLGAWLHGVARRVALRARGQVRNRAADGLDRIAILADPAPGPGHEAERAELLSLIDEELDRLPQRYRDVLVLCDLEGRTYTEAAQRLRCPLGTVQSRLARGRQRLRGRLAR
jgi:RNA polymerase sigma factor (sigma-70 family)